MVAANTEISPRETALARAFARLVERRWMLVAALAVLSGFAVAGVLGPWTAGALLLLFALAVAFLQPAETRSSLPGGVLLAPASGMAPAAPPAEQSAAFEAFADALPDPCFILDRRGVRWAMVSGADDARFMNALAAIDAARKGLPAAG